MPRPRFSEMLVNRRRQLGLSVTQASRVLRLREDVLIAFENGDFGRMPKSGYAQGMLSSYARYLGLSSRAVVNQFSADLFDYEHGRGGRRRGEEAAYELPGSSGPREGSRGLLPTSGGFAGDVTGFATTSPTRSRQQASPLVNQRQHPLRYQESESRDQDGLEPTRRYTGRDVSSRTGSRARGHRSRRPGQGRELPGSYREDVAVPRGNSDRVTTRRVDADDYTDDLRYGSARPYEAASTRTGRRSSRNIARADRPNVRRRGGEGRESLRERGRGRIPRRSGIAGLIEAYFSDARRTLATVVVAGALALTLIIIGSVKSCVRTPAATDARSVAVTTTAQSTSSGSGTSGTSATTESGSQAADEAAKAAEDAKAQKAAKEAETETKVDVKVADGATTWLEIESDGTSVIAEQVTGPWEKSFVVTESITVQVSDTTAATVTKNGTQQSFSSKSSGIGTITIQGTKPSAKTGDATSTGEGGSSADSSPSGSAAASGESATTDAGTDESSDTSAE